MRFSPLLGFALIVAALAGLATAAPTTTINFCHANGVGASLTIRLELTLWDNTTKYFVPSVAYATCAALNIDYNGLTDYRTVLRAYDIRGGSLFAFYYTPVSVSDATRNVAFFTQASGTGDALTWALRSPNTPIARSTGFSMALFVSYATGIGSDTIDFYKGTEAGAVGITFDLGASVNLSIAELSAGSWSARRSSAVTVPLATLETASATASVSQTTFFVLAGTVFASGENNFVVFSAQVPLAASSPSIAVCHYNPSSTGDATYEIAAAVQSSTVLVSKVVKYMSCENVAVPVPAGLLSSALEVRIVGVPTSMLYAPLTTDVSRNVIVGISGAELFSSPTWALVAPSMVGNPAIPTNAARVVVLHAGVGAGTIDASVGDTALTKILYGGSAGVDITTFAATTVKVTKDGGSPFYAQATFPQNSFVADGTVVAVFSGTSSTTFTVGAAGQSPVNTATTSPAAAVAIVPALMAALMALALLL